MTPTTPNYWTGRVYAFLIKHYKDPAGMGERPTWEYAEPDFIRLKDYLHRVADDRIKDWKRVEREFHNLDRGMWLFTIPTPVS